MIALNSLQVIFEKYLNSDSTNLLEFIKLNNYATNNANGELIFLSAVPIERFDESKINYKTIDYAKLGECLSFLDEVKGQLTAADLSLAKRWVANRIEVAFTEGKKLGSRKDVEKLIKDFEVYKNKTVDMRKKHPNVNKAQKVGKSVLGGAAVAGIAGGAVAAALTNGAAISSIPGLTANAAINFGVGASWGVVAAAVLGVSYYTLKHVITTAVNKAKFKGKKSIELIENSDKENIYEMEDVPSIQFLKLFAEKAADIIDCKPGKINLPGKIVKYFKIKANRNRLHTIEKHFKKDIVAEMERISKLLESDSYNRDLINKLARLQSYTAVINSVLDDVAMEDYRDLLSGDSKTRHSTYMDIILGADKKRNIINSKGRIHNAAKFDKLATAEEKDAKLEDSLPYNGKKPKELKNASRLYGASLIARALSMDNDEKSLIQARLEQNAEEKQAKKDEKQARKDEKQTKKDERLAAKDEKHEGKINSKIGKLNKEIEELQKSLDAEYDNMRKRAIGTPEYNNSAIAIGRLEKEINKKTAEIVRLEQSKPSYIAKHSEEVEEPVVPVVEPVVPVEEPVEETPIVPVVEEPEEETFEEELEDFKSLIKDWNLDKLTASAHLFEQTSKSRQLTKLQEKKWNLIGEEINNKNRENQLINAQLEEFKTWIKYQSESALITLSKWLKENHNEINEKKSDLIGEELNNRLREEQLKSAKPSYSSEDSLRTPEQPVEKPAEEKVITPVEAPVTETPVEKVEEKPVEEIVITPVEEVEEKPEENETLISRKIEETPIPPVEETPVDNGLFAPYGDEKYDDFFAPYGDEEEEDKKDEEVKQPAEVDETAAKIKELQKQKNNTNANRKKVAIKLEDARFKLAKLKFEFEENQDESLTKSIKKKVATAQVAVNDCQKEYEILDIEFERLKHEIEDLKNSQRKSDLD